MSGVYEVEQEEAAKIKVLVAGEFALVLDGICHSLESCEDIQVIGQANDGRESINQARNLQPDIAVIASNMRILDGFEATRHLSREMPNIKVIILTERGNRDNVADALLAGAWGCLPMATSRADLIFAIRMVYQGETYLHPLLTRCLVEDYLILRKATAYGDPYDSLTDREKHVLRLISEGLTIREISQQLGSAEKTVMGHKENIMKKLGVHDRIGLVKYAVRRGITDLEQ